MIKRRTREEEELKRCEEAFEAGIDDPIMVLLGWADWEIERQLLTEAHETDKP